MSKSKDKLKLKIKNTVHKYSKIINKPLTFIDRKKEESINPRRIEEDESKIFAWIIHDD